MSFSSNSNNCNLQTGPPIEDIQTEGIGFLALSGESKVQLLPIPWPRDNLPPPTASLMSVASKIGLLAAAGPNGVLLASTKSLRKSFENGQILSGNLRRFESQSTIPMKFRVSQVAFSADEKHLILSAEIGGGLAIYDVPKIMNGPPESAFELPTNGQALRALIPNPEPNNGELLAVVTIEGNLMMANLNNRTYIAKRQDFVLKDRVSCISWSFRGKQLVAGLDDGTAHQMTPEGEHKALIPRPPDVSIEEHISSILWLENHMFLIIYTPSSFDAKRAPPSKFYLVTRSLDYQNYTFQKIVDPAQPFGLNRSPPHHFILRLRDFPPDLLDVIILASTASTDIGLLTRSNVPLTKSKPPEKVTGVFTMTEMSDDSRRAQLPFSEKSGDTSPIGVSLDLSSHDKVFDPIPGDEISESSSPVPALMVLNNEGVLASWWFIYSESIRQKTIFPGLTASPAPANASKPFTSNPFGAGGTPNTSFGTAPFLNPTSTSILGINRSAPVFGSTSQLAPQTNFGTPSILSNQKSVWASQTSSNTFSSSTPIFGQNSFGSGQKNLGFSTAFEAPTFGKPSLLGPGTRTSPWVSQASNTPNTLVGNNTETGKNTLPFGSPQITGEQKHVPSNISAFTPQNTATGLATQRNAFNVFSENSEMNSFLPDQEGSAKVEESTSITPSRLGNTADFVLGTTFKPDTRSNEYESRTNSDQSNGFFGKNFDNILDNIAFEAVKDSSVTQVHDKSKENLDDNKTLPLPVSSIHLSSSSDTKLDHRNITKTENFSFHQNKLDVSSLKNSTPQLYSINERENEVSLVSVSKDKITNNLKYQTQVSESASTHNHKDIRETFLLQDTKLEDSKTNLLDTDATDGSKKKREDSNLSNQKNDQLIQSRTGVTEVLKDNIAGTDQIFRTRDQLHLEFKKATVENQSDKSSVNKHSSRGVLCTRESSQSSFSSGSEDDGQLSVFSNESNELVSSKGRKNENDEEIDDKSRAESETFSEYKSQKDSAKDSSFISETNQTSELSPESSYDILENNVFVEISKPDNNPHPDTLFDNFNPLDEENPSESSHTGNALESASQISTSKIKDKVNKNSRLNSTLQSLERKNMHEELAEPENTFQEDEENDSRNNPEIRKAGKLRAKSIAKKKVEEKPLSNLVANTEVEQRRHDEIVAQRKAEEKRCNEVMAQRKAEERRHKELLARWKDEEKRHEKLRAQKQVEEKQALLDSDDTCMLRFLASDLEPTTRLNDFVAHSDYVSTTSIESIPAQVERVYCDINSMIDTLGLNARSLNEFILGHERQSRAKRRTRDDLKLDSSWTLGEIESLSSIVENELAQELENGRMNNIVEMLEVCRDLQKDLIKLRTKHVDVKRIISISQDPNRSTIARAQPLGVKQASQQHDLRRDFLKFQKLLSEAEEGINILRAKITAQNTINKGSNISTGPTIDAIMRTITKLTSMIEKKSGDIDVLEDQIRKLKLNVTGNDSHQETITTPVKYKSTHRNPTTFLNHRLLTPENSKVSPIQNSILFSSPLGQFSPSRRKLSGFSPGEKALLRNKIDIRRKTANRLRLALQNTGVKVRLMENDI